MPDALRKLGAIKSEVQYNTSTLFADQIKELCAPEPTLVLT